MSQDESVRGGGILVVLIFSYIQGSLSPGCVLVRLVVLGAGSSFL